MNPFYWGGFGAAVQFVENLAAVCPSSAFLWINIGDAAGQCFQFSSCLNCHTLNNANLKRALCRVWTNIFTASVMYCMYRAPYEKFFCYLSWCNSNVRFVFLNGLNSQQSLQEICYCKPSWWGFALDNLSLTVV